MNLQESVREYVAEKQAAGASFRKGNQSLTSFCRHVGDLPLEKIQPHQVVTFLDGPRTSDLTWSRKYNLLRSFFLFCAARDLMRSPPMPAPRRPAARTFAPYIYSRAEIRLLLSTTRVSQAYEACRIDARTLRTFLLFLYGTGVLIGEGRRLLRHDIDFKRRTVTIRNARLQPTRTIPFSADVHKALQSYCNSHHRKIRGKDLHFFLNTEGGALKESYLNKCFQKLRYIAGIVRHDGISQPPRMHDLRYTFAVHRLTAWHKHGADLNRMVPALSVYMGYVRLGAATRFLRLTPERFRSQLDKLSPVRGKRRWRDDAALMRFLSAL